MSLISWELNVHVSDDNNNLCALLNWKQTENELLEQFWGFEKITLINRFTL